MSKINSGAVALARFEIWRHDTASALIHAVHVCDWTLHGETGQPDPEGAEDRAYGRARAVAENVASSPLYDNARVEIRAIRKDGRWWSPAMWNPAPAPGSVLDTEA